MTIHPAATVPSHDGGQIHLAVATDFTFLTFRSCPLSHPMGEGQGEGADLTSLTFRLCLKPSAVAHSIHQSEADDPVCFQPKRGGTFPCSAFLAERII